MLVDLYVEALLADESLADAIWEVWSAKLIADETATAMWRKCLFLPKADIGMTSFGET